MNHLTFITKQLTAELVRAVANGDLRSLGFIRSVSEDINRAAESGEIICTCNLLAEKDDLQDTESRVLGLLLDRIELAISANTAKTKTIT